MKRCLLPLAVLTFAAGCCDTQWTFSTQKLRPMCPQVLGSPCPPQATLGAPEPSPAIGPIPSEPPPISPPSNANVSRKARMPGRVS